MTKLNIGIFFAAVAVVVIALWLNNKVDISISKDTLSMSADKNPAKDTVAVKGVAKSKVEIENHEDQNVNVENVTDGSDVNIK